MSATVALLSLAEKMDISPFSTMSNCLSELVRFTDLALKQRTFCIWFKLICGKFIISAYLFHYSLHLAHVLIPNILAENSSPFFFIRVIVCCKCENNVQCSVISNCFYKVFSPKGNHAKKMKVNFLINQVMPCKRSWTLPNTKAAVDWYSLK